MTKKVVPFAKPAFTRGDMNEIYARIKEILQSGWLTSGTFVEKFEKSFEEFIGTKHAVALNSCTAALHTILLALNVKRGDEVIVPSNTFVATANSALYVGAKPVFADSDIQTFNIGPNDIQKKISRKTKAIIIVHIAGNPCGMKEILEIAEDAKIPLVEDCAHAHGAKYKEVNCGTFGVAGAFSFYPTKIITTAEGGIVTTNDETLAKKISIIRNHGRAAYGPSAIVELGFNYRLSEIHAAIGLSQLKHISEFIDQRNRISKFYRQQLAEISWLKPQRVKDGNFSSYYAFIVRLTDEAPISRDVLMTKLKELGIETSVLYHPVHLQPFYVELFRHRSNNLPIAEKLGKRSLALPLYNAMKKKEAKRVIESIKEASNSA